LIVDDEPVFLQQTSSCLEQHGYAVITARNGKDALAIADEGNIDLILLDIIMPVLNGVELTKILKRNPRTSEIPIIVVSTMTEYKDRVEFFRIGANDYMPKPIDNGELMARVELQLQVINLRKEVEAANQTLMQKNRVLEQYLTRIEHDLSVARNLQRSLQPLHKNRLGNASLYFEHTDSENLGSDYIDYLLDDDGLLHVLMSDVSGHGIPSALLAAQLKMLFLTTTRRGLPAAQLVGQLNRVTTNFLIEGYYFTALYLQYDQRRGKLTVINAGHIPLLFYDQAANKIKLVESTNAPLGFLEDEEFVEIEFEPAPGDIALLITDGLTEHKNANNEMFDMSGAIGVFKRHFQSEPEVLVKALVKEAREFGELPVFKDDVTLCAIRFEADGEKLQAGG
jgi:sigma-B regulation protein RsbU (phosphoserine phosphatase)